ncbi:hypothetical protein HXX76_005255 [Chlamydomonas incerta]|uniref:UBZ4-type domain-containing protein n=1 Tax=Chlamydomonas incerta TaxID=51695 RepID=A0A835TE49_CHLIN|nr:hypothetical protein HXX76_005255 [Chlamydomonas incerta]|eukprot:KAG2438709.1 hypothetical protein HXX76_005255 [Chlamydomonas incerta]
MCIRQSLDFAHANKQKGTCPSCRADCNSDQLRRVDALRLAITALPRAAAAVHDLRRCLEETERRLRDAENAGSVTQDRSGLGTEVAGAAAAAAAGASGAALRPGGRASHAAAEAPTGTLAGAARGRPRRGAAQQQASQPPARSTRQAARQAHGGPSSKRQAVGDTRARRAAGGDGEEDDSSDADGLVSSEWSDGDGGLVSESEEVEDEEDVLCDLEEDYSPNGRNQGPRQPTAATGPAAGPRKRGRPSSTAAAAPAAARQPHHGAAGARGSGSAPPAHAPAPAPRSDMGDCPLCGRTYGMVQLQAHVDVCLARQAARSGGAVGLPGAAASLARGPSPGAAAAAGGVKPGMTGPLARSFGGGGGAGAGGGGGAGEAAGVALAGLRGRPGASGAAAAVGAGGGGASAPSRPPTDVKVPPAHAWHSMTDKAARKIMAGIGLPTTGDKNEWSNRYNRYRTFLRTERDRCTTLSMDQLLRAFLQKEQQEDAGRRQPAAAPNWMLNQIREAAERMKLVQRSQQAAAAQRARSAPASGANDDDPGDGGGGGGCGGEGVSPTVPSPATEQGGDVAEEEATATAAARPPWPQAARDVAGRATAGVAGAAVAAGPGPRLADRDVIMIGSDSEEDPEQRHQAAAGVSAEPMTTAAAAAAAAAAAGLVSEVGAGEPAPGNGGPEPGAHEPRRLAPAEQPHVPGSDAAASSAAAAAAADQHGAGAAGGDGVAAARDGNWPAKHSEVMQHPHREEQQAELDQEQELEQGEDETPPPRSSQWMRGGSPPPGADEDRAAGFVPVVGASWGLPWALDYGGRGAAVSAGLGASDSVGSGEEAPANTDGVPSALAPAPPAGGGWLADISNGVGSQRQAWPLLQTASDNVPGAAGKAVALALDGQRRPSS